MKLNLFLFAFPVLFLLFFIPGAGSASAENKPLELQVMLFDNVKEIPLPAYCGEHITDAVVKYKVMKVVHGFYLKSTILIHHKCLREAIENHSIANHITYVYKVKQVLPLAGDADKQTYEIVL